MANVSSEEFARIQKLAAEEQLSQEQVASAVPYIPNYRELQKESIQKLGAVIEKAGTSQQTALDIVRKSLDTQLRILEHMANSATTDETRLKLADITKEVGQNGRQIALAMSQDNNQFWGRLGKGGDPIGRSSLFDIDPKWDDPSNDDLGDFYSSHVHPTFWRLHGWIDDRINDWARVNAARIETATIDGVPWFAADGQMVLVSFHSTGLPPSTTTARAEATPTFT